MPEDELKRIEEEYIDKYHPLHYGSASKMASTSKNIQPIRGELLKVKRRIELAERGHELLRVKRDALITEFFDNLDLLIGKGGSGGKVGGDFRRPDGREIGGGRGGVEEVGQCYD